MIWRAARDLFTGLKQAVGDEAANYLRKNALGLISVTDADSFKRVSPVAAALGKIIEDRTHVLTFKFSPEGTPVTFQKQQYRLGPAFPANTSGGTFKTTLITSGPLGSLLANVMENVEKSPNSLPLILAHEIGHVDAEWYRGVRNSNDDAVVMENSLRSRLGLPIRRLHDPIQIR